MTINPDPEMYEEAATLMRRGAAELRLSVIGRVAFMTAYAHARIAGFSHEDLLAAAAGCKAELDRFVREPDIDARDPDEQWEPKVGGRVYAIRSDAGHIKIGFTTGDVNNRRSVLQTGSPHKLELVGAWVGSRHDERQLHEMFSERRLTGEWFDDSDQLISDLVATLVAS